ncbi:MAG: sialate O-acetylesterase, partial [Tepidisphaeraceae bacterium]
MRTKIFCLSLLTCMALMAASAADSPSRPFVSPMFGDNMVLQRGKPIRFWGWTKAGEPVRV